MFAFCTLRLALGLILLLAPDRVLRAAGGRDGGRVPRWIVRLLGARHLAQAALVTRRGDARAVRWGAAVDATHGLSMVALARSGTRSRRPAAIAAASASAWTVCGLWLARRLPPRR